MFLKISVQLLFTNCQIPLSFWRFYLGRGGGGEITSPTHPLPSWFSLNNSKTVRAVTLEFGSIQQYFIEDIRAKFGIHNLSQSPDTGQNSDGGISDFRISAQSLIKENCYNSKTSDDIDIKLGPVTKLNKRNKRTSKIWWWCHVWKLWNHCRFSEF